MTSEKQNFDNVRPSAHHKENVMSHSPTQACVNHRLPKLLQVSSDSSSEPNGRAGVAHGTSPIRLWAVRKAVNHTAGAILPRYNTIEFQVA
jgi:hypothetical protein